MIKYDNVLSDDGQINFQAKGLVSINRGTPAFSYHKFKNHELINNNN